MMVLILPLVVSMVYATHAPEQLAHPLKASVDQRVQTTLDEILDQFPGLKGRLPIDLVVKDTTDISDDVREIVSGDLNRPDALRFKILRMLLWRTAIGDEERRHAALSARVYAISKAKVAKDSSFYVPGGLHLTPANVGEYTANLREVKRYQKDSNAGGECTRRQTATRILDRRKSPEARLR